MGEESEKIDKKEPKAADVPKKPRGRKKLQYQTLRKQMEFYFSDANLSKDRFIGQLLKESKYIDLNVFLRFNRIKNITSNIKDIVNALQSSDLLKVTECGTKVYREKPVESKSNIEECTIYVENIPAKADHDYLTDTFSSYGPIDYVSIPRYKHSQMNKGFAFIEFKYPESVEKTITAFKGFGNHLLDKIEPAQLCSIKTFNEEKDMEKADDRRNQNKNDKDRTSGDDSFNNDPDESSSTKSREVEKHDKKRKKGETECSDDESRPIKTKVEQSEPAGSCRAKRKISSGSDHESSETEAVKRRKAESDEQLTKKMKKEQADDSATSSNETNTKKKKKRSVSSGENEAAPENVMKNRKESDELCADEDGNNASRREKNQVQETADLPNQDVADTDENLALDSSNNEDEVGDFDSAGKKRHRKRTKKAKREKAFFGLQILTKKEWKVMRNRYLTEQRNRMSNLKKHLKQKRWEHYNSTKEQQIEESEYTEEKEEEEEEKEREEEGENPSNVKPSDARVSYQQGVIVKILLDEPVVDKDTFKNDLKRNPEIKYIDVKECSNTVHLRFSSSDGSQKFVQNSPWQRAMVLEGSEEQDYWDKVWKDREHKMNKNIRKPKNGRKKLLEKAESVRAIHIRFD